MAAMTGSVLAVLLIAAFAAGCATAESPAARGMSTPQARCLIDPNETGTRPLIFLFCIQSP